MPSGSMPTYAYRPPVAGSSPYLRSRYNRRARLWAGGTYFRTINAGLMGNNISIALVEYGPSDSPTDGYLVVTNHNTISQENVTGPVVVNLLEQNIPWNKKIVIENLDTQPRAKIYSISLQIAPPTGSVPDPVDLGPVSLSGLIHIPPYVSAKVTLDGSVITPDSTITFESRTSVYKLVSISKDITTPSAGGGDDGTAPSDSGDGGGTTTSSTGWDPADLRSKVTAKPDPWIEMLERSGTGDPGSGNTGPKDTGSGPSGDSSSSSGTTTKEKKDTNDNGVDDNFLSAFDDTYMSGGDGLPPTPTVEQTGPERSIVFVNRGELQNGDMGDVNKIYEWVGSSANSGSWVPY